MKKYLTVLLADIAEAKNNRPDFRPMSDDEIIPFEMDDYMDDTIQDKDEPDETPKGETKSKGNIREIMGFSPEQFPPADYWTSEEAAELVVALNDIFAHFHLGASYPRDLPPLMAYSTLVGAMERYAPIMPFGTWYLEFCNYNPEECPFGEAYCSCNKLFSDDLMKTDEERLTEALEKADTISGVHNYCDRWCERCRFSSRCSVGAMSESEFEDTTPTHAKIGLWYDNSEKLLAAQTWLKTQLTHIDTSLISVKKKERRIFDRLFNDVRRDIDAVPVIQLSERYMKQLLDWFKTDTIKTLLETVENQEIGDFTEGGLKESLSVIQWYLFFINVKFRRAVGGKIEDDDFGDDCPKDSDGSAKIALISAENALVAWSDFRQIQPDESAFALKMMALLQAIIEEGEREFPDARAFVRAGFDTIV